MQPHQETISRDEAKLPLYVGVDLGGTTIKLGVVDDNGRTLSFHRLSTHAVLGPEQAAQRMGRAVLEAIEEAGTHASEIARVGLGSPGTMDLASGMLQQPPNLPGWGQFAIRDRLSHHCGLPVTLANDGAAAAYGEYWVGSGRDFDSIVMLTLGTGIGCGIIVDGMSIDGAHSHGAECGHIVIDYHENARLCSCGQTGHLEAYASATAVIRRTEERLQAGLKSSITARLEHGAELVPVVVAEEAEAGDPVALELVMDTALYLGVGIVTLIHTIDPSGVLIGGGMTFGGHDSPLGRRFLDRIREEVRKRAFPIPATKTTIDYAALGGDAGYIGAAGLARAEHQKR